MTDVAFYESQEIKEFHFHVYLYQSSEESVASAKELRQKVIDLNQAGFITVVVGSFHTKPVGPHISGMFQVWCPKEHFSRLYSFFLINRGDHPIMIHPLTTKEIKDHTERAGWLGQPLPLIVNPWLHETLPHTPLENPELKLGYSASK